MAMTEYTVMLAAVNAALLASLLYLYVQNYRRIRSSFVLGLLLFAGLLLVENLLAFYFSLTMMGLYQDTVALHAFILRTVETASLLVLTYITWRH